MADGLHSKRLSLDTNVLMDMAAGYDFAVGFREVFQAKGYTLCAVPGVLAELDYLSKNGTEVQQERALKAIDSLIEWKISIITLSDLEKTYRTNFIRFAEHRKLLPPAEKNDVVILADTAIAEIQVLVTTDQTLREVDGFSLKLACADAGLSIVSVAEAAGMWRAMRKALR